MNKQKYDNQALTEYLLGSLSEEKTERFDELSFTDEDFADALKSAEQNLVDAYVQGELSGAALERFNSYYLASPLRREKVNFARAFQTYAGQNASEIETKPIAKETDADSHSGFFSFLNVFSNPLQWGMAAAALLVIATVGFWLLSNRTNQTGTDISKQNTPSPNPIERQNPNQNSPSAIPGVTDSNAGSGLNTAGNTQTNINTAAGNRNVANIKPSPEATKKPVNTETPKPRPVPSAKPELNFVALILAAPLRSVGKLPSLTIPSETSDVKVQLQLDSDEYLAYRVTLGTQGAQPSWTSGLLKTRLVDGSKTLKFRVPAKILKSQIYLFAVTGIKANGETEIISNYPFRVVLN